jgi:class 3 adenylate cyclase
MGPDLESLLDLAPAEREAAAAARTRIVAVLVVDMSGFSRITDEERIVPALLAIRDLQRIVMEEVAARGGAVVKFDADNAFCVLEDPVAAGDAAQAIVGRFPSSAGIGFGPVLFIDGDLFGGEVNRASKLGEDIAKAGEVLPTEAAQAAAPSTFP